MTGRRIVGSSLGALPTYAFGSRGPIWWGTLGFMLIEGTAFVLAAGAYLYIRGRDLHWPPEGTAPPDLLWGTLFTVVMLASLAPNLWLDKAAKARDLRASRLGMAIMTAIAVVALVIRGFEFPHLNTHWHDTAYGSVTWALIALHTTHVVTDFADTAALGAFVFTHEVDGKRFTDVSDNAHYWNFVVLSWLPLYALIYWAPRVL